MSFTQMETAMSYTNTVGRRQVTDDVSGLSRSSPSRVLNWLTQTRHHLFRKQFERASALFRIEPGKLGSYHKVGAVVTLTETFHLPHNLIGRSNHGCTPEAGVAHFLGALKAPDIFVTRSVVSLGQNLTIVFHRIEEMVLHLFPRLINSRSKVHQTHTTNMKLGGVV